MKKRPRKSEKHKVEFEGAENKIENKGERSRRRKLYGTNENEERRFLKPAKKESVRKGERLTSN
jgi:hypothetical protein